MTHCAQKELGIDIPYEIVSPRSGDIGSMYAEVTHIREDVGWISTTSPSTSIRNAYNFLQKNISIEKNQKKPNVVHFVPYFMPHA